MTTVLIVAVVVLFILIALLFGALVELFNDLRQLREQAELMDSANDLAIPSAHGKSISELGLPHADKIVSSPAGGLLLLSNGCGTCRTLAHGLHGMTVPNMITVLYPGADVSEDESLNSTYELEGVGLFIDRFGSVADALGVYTTPSLLHTVNGRIVSAETIPTTRILFERIADLRKTDNITTGAGDVNRV